MVLYIRFFIDHTLVSVFIDNYLFISVKMAVNESKTKILTMDIDLESDSDDSDFVNEQPSSKDESCSESTISSSSTSDTSSSSSDDGAESANSAWSSDDDDVDEPTVEAAVCNILILQILFYW
jgi:hypothetical protein